MAAEQWAIKAVEREAMTRARSQIAREIADGMVVVGGLTLAQVMWLRRDYVSRTGRSPQDIDPTTETDEPEDPEGK